MKEKQALVPGSTGLVAWEISQVLGREGCCLPTLPRIIYTALYRLYYTDRHCLAYSYYIYKYPTRKVLPVQVSYAGAFTGNCCLYKDIYILEV